MPLDRDKVNSQLRRLEEHIGHLDEVRRGGQEAFLKDSLVEAAAERYLQIAIETILNLGNHVIAVQGLRLPQEYADIFRILEEAGILKSELVPRFVEMARFRNKLVHLYWEIDKLEIWKILQDDLGDLVTFEKIILGLIEHNKAND